MEKVSKVIEVMALSEKAKREGVAARGQAGSGDEAELEVVAKTGSGVVGDVAVLSLK